VARQFERRSMPQDPVPPEGERRPSEYQPPTADELDRDDNVETVGIVATGQDAD
jgi:hypothetical protein